MAAALGSSLPAPADATTAAPAVVTVAAAAVATAVAAAAATAVATVAAAQVSDDLEDPLDTVLASALEGINLALSMDKPLGFSAMCPISREPEIQGEPPHVISLSSPLSKGEHHSTVSLVTFLGNISSFMDMLLAPRI